MIFSVHGSAWYVCLSILPWKPRPLHNSFNAADFKPRGQPWRTFLVSNCLCFSCLSHPCLILTNFDCHVYFRKTVVRKSIFLSFSFLECADTSRYDLELESEWKGRALTMQTNISGRTNLWTLEIMSWTSDKHIYMNLELESTFSSPIREVTVFHLTRADPKPVNNVFIFITSGFLLRNFVTELA